MVFALFYASLTERALVRITRVRDSDSIGSCYTGSNVIYVKGVQLELIDTINHRKVDSLLTNDDVVSRLAEDNPPIILKLMSSMRVPGVNCSICYGIHDLAYAATGSEMTHAFWTKNGHVVCSGCVDSYRTVLAPLIDRPFVFDRDSVGDWPADRTIYVDTELFHVRKHGELSENAREFLLRTGPHPKESEFRTLALRTYSEFLSDRDRGRP